MDGRVGPSASEASRPTAIAYFGRGGSLRGRVACGGGKDVRARAICGVNGYEEANDGAIFNRVKRFGSSAWATFAT